MSRSKADPEENRGRTKKKKKLFHPALKAITARREE